MDPDLAANTSLCCIDLTDGDGFQGILEKAQTVRTLGVASELIGIVSDDASPRITEMLRAGLTYFLEPSISATSLARVISRSITYLESSDAPRLDELTSVYTRDFFEDVLQSHIAEITSSTGGQRRGGSEPFSVILLDIDHLNDIAGGVQRVGDKILQEVATVIMDSNRASDIVTRIGQDEFAVLLKGLNYTLALMRAEMIRKAVFDLQPQAIQLLGEIQVSIGVATFPGVIEAPTEIMKYCHDALGSAKSLGGNVVCGLDNAGIPQPFAMIGG